MFCFFLEREILNNTKKDLGLIRNDNFFSFFLFFIWKHHNKKKTRKRLKPFKNIFDFFSMFSIYMTTKLYIKQLGVLFFVFQINQYYNNKKIIINRHLFDKCCKFNFFLFCFRLNLMCKKQNGKEKSWVVKNQIYI